MRRRRDLAAGRQSSAFSLLFQAMWPTCRAARSVAANRRKTGRGGSRNTSADPFAGARTLAFWRPRFADPSFLRYRDDIWEAGKAPAPGDRKDFVKILRLSAALATLTLTASTTCAAVIDL